MPSLDKADLQRPNELTVQAGRAAISVSFTWWVIEAPPPPPQPTADGGAEEEPPPSVGKYNILGIIDSTYLLRIHIDDTWNTTRPMLGMVFIKRRAVTTATPRKALRSSGPRTWCDRTATFRVEADFREVSDGKVHLLKLNGVRVAVPLERLCKADLLHLNMVRAAVTQAPRIPPFRVSKQKGARPGLPSWSASTSRRTWTWMTRPCPLPRGGPRCPASKL